jgi:6-phospho-3-hexuloisomerase
MQDPKGTETNEASSFSASFTAILEELKRTLLALSEAQLHTAVQSLLCARRVFFVGAGRSRLALEMAAMRMMHLGLTVYVAGEVVTPAIERGDLLVVASGSGTTAGPVRAARVAKELGAEILAITTAPASELGNSGERSSRHSGCGQTTVTAAPFQSSMAGLFLNRRFLC